MQRTEQWREPPAAQQKQIGVSREWPWRALLAACCHADPGYYKPADRASAPDRRGFRALDDESRPPHVWKKALTREPPATPLSAAAQEKMTTTRRVQSSSNAVKKPPWELRRLPPIIGAGARADNRRRNNGASATAGTDLAERAAKACMRHALAKRVATRMLKRSMAPPRMTVTDEGSGREMEKVIACCCALHQDGAPGRAWMRSQRRGGGGEWGEAVAVAAPKAHGWAFSEYARWRRHVWMPSRFYLERVEADEHRAAAERLRLVTRL